MTEECRERLVQTAEHSIITSVRTVTSVLELAMAVFGQSHPTTQMLGRNLHVLVAEEITPRWRN